MEVSVVTTCYNNLEVMRNTLPWWGMQDFSDFEVVLVDDGSPLDSGIREFAEFLGVKYFRQERRAWGCARARNEGIWHASGQRILFVDSDCIPHPYLIKEHLSIAAEDVVVAGVVHHTFKELPHTIGWWDKGKPVKGIPISRHQLWAGNFSILRKHIVALRGFDERYETTPLRLSTDWDIANRVFFYGLKIIANPDAAVYHISHKEVKNTCDMAAHHSRIESKLTVLDTTPESWVI